MVPPSVTSFVMVVQNRILGVRSRWVKIWVSIMVISRERERVVRVRMFHGCTELEVEVAVVGAEVVIEIKIARIMTLVERMTIWITQRGIRIRLCQGGWECWALYILLFGFGFGFGFYGRWG